MTLRSQVPVTSLKRARGDPQPQYRPTTDHLFSLKHREDGFFDAVWIDKKNAISDQTIESYDSLGEANGGFIKQTFLDHVKEKGHNVRQPVRWTGSGGMGLRSGNVTGMELKEHKTRFFHDSLDCLPNALFNLLDLMQQVAHSFTREGT